MMNEQKQKTALELVDELSEKWMNYYPSEVCKSLAEIKEAIIYEQGKACASFAKQCNETAQDALKFRKLEQSATMRPISELPDKVPYGCVIVAVNHRDSWIWLDDIPKSWVERGVYRELLPTCFYVIPKPARKLHACYMPRCGGVAELEGDDADYHRVVCSKCGTKGPICATEEEAQEKWGWE